MKKNYFLFGISLISAFYSPASEAGRLIKKSDKSGACSEPKSDFKSTESRKRGSKEEEQKNRIERIVRRKMAEEQRKIQQADSQIQFSLEAWNLKGAYDSLCEENEVDCTEFLRALYFRFSSYDDVNDFGDLLSQAITGHRDNNLARQRLSWREILEGLRPRSGLQSERDAIQAGSEGECVKCGTIVGTSCYADDSESDRIYCSNCVPANLVQE